MKRSIVSLGAVFLLSGTAGLYAQNAKGKKKEPPAATTQPVVAVVTTKKPEVEKKLLYTTYFYTSAEAVVHGYEAGTNAKILSLESGAVVWHGTVGEGETVNVPTGPGVFGF